MRSVLPLSISLAAMRRSPAAVLKPSATASGSPAAVLKPSATASLVSRP